MADLNEIAEEYRDSVAAATHLLIIGQSKMGKSDYVAQAAIDGFDIIYVDADNGLPTLMDRLKGNTAAMSRVHYFNPVSMRTFMLAMIKSGKVIYNERTRDIYASHVAKPEDKLTIIYPPRLRRYRNVIVSVDSWTSWCLSALEAAAKEQKVELTAIDKYGREIYGPSGYFMSQMGNALQLAPFNVIVQAHPSIYEIKEKPKGVAREIKEADMIIKETWEIPMSTSGPHGYSIGKFFNQIGWLELPFINRYELSFEPKPRRLVGGTVNPKKGDPRTVMSYKKLFGGGLELPAPIPESFKWIEKTTVAEYQESTKAAAPATPPTKPAAAKPAAPATATASAPTQLATKPSPLKIGGGVKLG